MAPEEPAAQLPPAEGEFVKVSLPGETPWAICRAVHTDGSWDGEINNDLVSEKSEEERAALGEHFFPGQGVVFPVLHDFRCGQVVRFNRESREGRSVWAPTRQQQGTAAASPSA